MILLRHGVGGGLREGGEWEANSKAARIKQRLGTIKGEEGGRPWKSKGSLPSEPAQCTARTLPGEPVHSRTACTPLG